MRGITLWALMVAACATQGTASGGGQGDNQGSSSAELTSAPSWEKSLQLIGGKYSDISKFGSPEQEKRVIRDGNITG